MTSYKCKYIMTTDAVIAGCSENDFLVRGHFLKLPVKVFSV